MKNLVKGRKMKKVTSFILLVILLLSFCSCNESKKYEAQDYILETEWKDDFKILQITDVHLSVQDERDKVYEFLEKVIKAADADFIAITGDSFFIADKNVVKEFVAFFDSFKTPWTFTLGNHDEGSYFSIDWLTSYLNEHGEYLLFKDIQDDEVFGNSNFAINLTENGKVKEQVIVLDSNRYYFGDEYIGYDYVKEDQIAWYEDIVKFTAKNNGGEVVPSIVFMHIPVPEFTMAIEAAEKESEDSILIDGKNSENVCDPEINSGLFDKMLELGSTKAICVGHDHINSSTYLYKGIYLSYGIKSSNRLYFDDARVGGRLITISNGEYEFKDLLYTVEVK